MDPLKQPTPIRYLSVCSGMEAASVAWHPLGWQPVGFSEIEPFPCAILQHRFPNIPNYGSLTEHSTWPIEPGSTDLLVGGTPCQSFSVAGLRKGMSDPRGNLALVFLGLADRIKPRWIVWENVPGVLSSNGGRDFGSFLGALGELGYGFAYRVLDAQHFGVPQRRRRVFVVAHLGDWRPAAEVLFESDCLRGNPPKGRAKGQGVAPGVEGGVGAEGCWWDGGQVSQTLDAVLAKGQTMPEKNRFPAVLQPKVSHWDGSEVHPTLNQSAHGSGSPGYSNQELFSQGGGGLVPAIPCRKSKRAASVTDNETWVDDGIANTLNNFDLGDTRTTHAVVQQVYENHPNDSLVTGPHDVAPTIVSRYGTGGGNVPLVNGEPSIVRLSELRLTGKITEQSICPTLTSGAKQGDSEPLALQPIAFQPGNLVRKAGADPSTEVFPTLSKDSGDQNPHVAVPMAIDTYNQTTSHISKTLTCKASDVDHVGGVLVPPMAVRRLTPTECERLQGFPDGWSQIPWKNKPADQCPDGPRYKACGNSMAVPVMRWIGQRIAEVDACIQAEVGQ